VVTGCRTRRLADGYRPAVVRGCERRTYGLLAPPQAASEVREVRV